MKKNAFTILEMMVVLLIVAVLLFISLPSIQQKETIIRDKGCHALLEIINSQIMLFEIDEGRTPTSISELVDKKYIKKSQTACPNHKDVVIENGEAKAV